MSYSFNSLNPSKYNYTANCGSFSHFNSLGLLGTIIVSFLLLIVLVIMILSIGQFNIALLL